MLISHKALYNLYNNLPKVQLSYSSADFHLIRNQPYPLQTDFENVPDFRFTPVETTTSLFPDWFSPNSQPTLPFANWFWKCSSLIQVQVCPKHNFFPQLIPCPNYDFLFPRPTFTKLDTNEPYPSQNDFVSFYLIQVQVGPKYNFFIPWAIFTKFNKTLHPSTFM